MAEHTETAAPNAVDSFFGGLIDDALSAFTIRVNRNDARTQSQIASAQLDAERERSRQQAAALLGNDPSKLILPALLGIGGIIALVIIGKTLSG